MSLQLRCAGCGKTLRLSDDWRGRSGSCPNCKTRFRVPNDPSAHATQPLGYAATHQAVPPATALCATTPPKQIGRYVLGEMLGEGASGKVFRAFDPRLRREVALKVPQTGTLDDPKLIERFQREGKAVANLHHPHIVPVFDAGRDGTTCYLALALIPGGTLKEALQSGPFDQRRAASLVRDLAEALAYAHSEGVIHRDVKRIFCWMRQERHT